MKAAGTKEPRRRLPRLASVVLRVLLPAAARDEVLDDLAEEYGRREAEQGGYRARRWLWRQVVGSSAPLLRGSWWRGWSGFQPRANRYRPGGSMIEGWIQDARYTFRRLRMRPTYATLAVLTLGLGVGGTAAIFGIVRGFLLEPLPYTAEEEIAVFWNPYDWSEAEFEYLRPEFPGFRQVASYRSEDVTLDLRDGSPRFLPGIASSTELFNVLGVRPLVGTGFGELDDRQGAEPVVVLSHRLWRELGGSPSIVGERLRLNGEERTVVGVMPRGFWFPDPTVQLWLSTPFDPANRSGRYALVGRLEAGQGPAEITGSLARITAALGERFDYPVDWDKTRNAALTPVREYLIGSVRPALLATLAAMGVILLIACANVATLMLGQVDGRSLELSVRSALGAGRQRLLRQLVVEAVVVGLAAGLVGAVLAAFGFRVLLGALPLGAMAESASLDWGVFWAAMSIAIVASLAISLVPGISIVRTNLQGRLRTARAGGIGRGGRLEGGLVVAEVALAVLMAAGAALLIRSVSNLYSIDPGVQTSGLAVVDIVMPRDIGADARRRLAQELVTELGALPGVRSAAATQKLPLRGPGDSWGIDVEDRPELESSTTYFRMVAPGYFETMGIRLLDGRTFDVTDRAGGELVVVINRALAEAYLPGLDPIGRRISTGFGWERIVGVVDDVAEANLTDGPVPARYMLYDQIPPMPTTIALVLRAGSEQAIGPVLDAARATIARVGPGVAIQRTTSMDRVFTEAVGPARQIMTLLTLLGALALVLGAVGVYGIVSHFVARRRRELGIRLALGLVPSKVVAGVVGRGSGLVAVGIAVGSIAFIALARLLGTFLYGVGAADPLALAAAATALFTAGVAAAFVPARRASRIDPAVVLRQE